MRGWISSVILFCLVQAAVPSLAADLESAERALESRLLRLATEQFREVLGSGPSPEAEIRARIGLARAHVLSGRPQEAQTLLNDLPPIGDPVWSVRASLVAADLALLREDYRRAAALLEAVPESIDGAGWESRRIRLQARVWFSLGRQKEALGLLESRMEGDPAIRQEWASMLHRAGQTDKALEVWEALGTGEPGRLETQQARLALIRHAVEAGDWDPAGEGLNALMKDGGVYEELEPAAYPLMVRWFAHQKQYDQAVAYLLALEARVPSPALVPTLRAHRAQNLILAGKEEEARDLLRDLIAKVGDHPLVAQAHLLLAQTLADDGRTEDAREAFDVYLSVFTEADGIATALAGRARMEEKLDRWKQAEASYARAAAALDAESPRRVQLEIKRADMALAAGDNAKAHEVYEQVLADAPEPSLRAHAQFHSAVALARSDHDRLRSAIRMLRELRVQMPDSPFSEKALLQIAVLEQEAGQFGPALGSFTSYLNEYPDGEFVVDAMVDKGIVSYRNNYYKIALVQFEQVVSRFPDHPRAEQAFSLQGWMLYLMGQDEDARKVGEAFLETYPDSEFEPHVRLWMAGMSFNRGRYERAEREFSVLADRAGDPLREIQARYYAGQAALSRKAYEQALVHLNAALERAVEVGESAAELDYVQEALFYKGDALTELDRFDEAIVTFNRFIARYPDSYLKYAAVGRRGDCQFTLGESKKERYREALSSYQLVTESTSVRPDVQLQALYKLGRTQMALDRVEEAFSTYQTVIDRYLSQRERMGSDASIWFVRAVTDAAQAREDRGEYREAVRIYEGLASTSLPQAEEARRRMREIRENHNLLQFQGEQP